MERHKQTEEKKQKNKSSSLSLSEFSLSLCCLSFFTPRLSFSTAFVSLFSALSCADRGISKKRLSGTVERRGGMDGKRERKKASAIVVFFLFFFFFLSRE